MSNIWLSAALLELASRDGNCGYLFHDYDDDAHEEDDRDFTDCDKVYGMSPSNVYSNLATVAALTVAVTMPIVGSIVDHTRFRKHVALGSLATLTVVSFTQAMVSRDTWFAVALLQIVSIAAAMYHSLAVTAYLPELSATQVGRIPVGRRANDRQFFSSSFASTGAESPSRGRRALRTLSHPEDDARPRLFIWSANTRRR